MACRGIVWLQRGFGRLHGRFSDDRRGEPYSQIGTTLEGEVTCSARPIIETFDLIQMSQIFEYLSFPVLSIYHACVEMRAYGQLTWWRDHDAALVMYLSAVAVSLA